MIRWIIIFYTISLRLHGQVTPDEVVKVNFGELNVRTGEISKINIFIEVKEGYHIQAHEVKDEFIVPTTLEIDECEEFTIKKLIFPRPVKFKLEGTEKYLDVYNGRFEIKTFLKIQKQIQKGHYNLNGKVNYQACDSVRCHFPRSVNFSVIIRIE
jgi:thioredoxin:protein disulfide reductase